LQAAERKPFHDQTLNYRKLVIHQGLTSNTNVLNENSVKILSMSEKNILQSFYARIWGSISVLIHAEIVTKVKENNNNNNNNNNIDVIHFDHSCTFDLVFQLVLFYKIYAQGPLMITLTGYLPTWLNDNVL
jgi:hypothetical protein